MDGLEYRFDYCDDPPLRKAFNDFLVEIHDLDLTLWEERVGWDPDFVPFSFFEGDRVVASTSVYVMDLLVRGEWRKAAQLSSVGTTPRLRRRGLNAELTRRAKEWIARHAPGGTFFFAADDAVGFYAKQGYVERPEWRSVVHVPPRIARPAYRTLDYERDESLIVRLVEERMPVSSVLGVKSPKLELFHFLYENAGELRYLDEFDLLAAVEVEGRTMSVYDLVGPRLPRWSEIAPSLLDPGVREVSFELTPDRLGLEAARRVEERKSRLHVVEQEDLIVGEVMVPFTGHA